MPKFGTELLSVNVNRNGNYKNSKGRFEVEGNWRSRPRGRRFFTDDQIRQMRAMYNSRNGYMTLRDIAEHYDCSQVSVYHIVNGSTYRDVI